MVLYVDEVVGDPSMKHLMEETNDPHLTHRSSTHTGLILDTRNGRQHEGLLHLGLA